MTALVETSCDSRRDVTLLFDPRAFEPLTETQWNEPRVRDAIQAIVAAAEEAFDDAALWPAGEWESWQTPLPLKNLYVGAAGVLWALHALRGRGRRGRRPRPRRTQSLARTSAGGRSPT